MEAVRLIGAYLVAIALLLLPATACLLAGRRFGVKNPVLLLICGFVGSGLLGFAVFWIYLLDPTAGRVAGIGVNAASALVLLDSCRHGFARWRQLRSLAPVTALFAAAGLFNLALGYLRGGLQADIAPNRYLAGLPGDNELPLLFAQQLQSRVRPLPHFLAWGFQSSDRPPLQTGYYLIEQSVLGSGRFENYQVFSTLLQGTWIFGLWALLYAARKPRWAVPLCLASALFSGFTIVNSLFTWPKLVSATGVLLACAVLLTPEMSSLRKSRVAGALVGCALGVSMLGHPGGIFAVPGIVLIFAVLWPFRSVRPRGWLPPSPGFLGAATGALMAAYLPWVLYQKYYQPPGNALFEIQMANAPTSVPGKSTTQVIVDAYRQLNMHQIVSNKVSNLTTPFDHSLGYFWQAARLVYDTLSGQHAAAASAAHQEISWQFFYIGPILGIVGWGMVILVARALRDALASRSPRGFFSLEMVWLLSVAFSLVIWALVLFGPSATYAHQGAYSVELICFALGVLGWWSVSPRLAAVVVAASSALILWLFIGFTPDRAVRGSGMATHASASDAVLLTASILACIASLWWIGIRGATAPGESEAAAVPVQVSRFDTMGGFSEDNTATGFQHS